MPNDTPQVDWQNDPNFQALPLAEKHKALLQIDSNYKGLPAKEQAKALDAIHYGPLGQISGEGVSLKGAGTAAWNYLKGMAPDPTGGHPILSKEAWYGTPRIESNEESGIGKMAQEASAEYQRARAAGTNPVAAGYSAAISGAGPLVGVSDLAQQEQAKQGEGGAIIGESAVPIGLTLASPLIGKMGIEARRGASVPAGSSAGGLSPEVTGAIGRKAGELTRIPGAGWAGEKIGRRFGKAASAPPPSPSPFAGMTPTDVPIGNAELPPATGEQAPFPRVQTRAEIRAAEAANKAAVKAAEKAQAAAEKAAAKAPSNPFAGMTSTATSIGNAELPPVPKGQPAIMPTVAKAVRKGLKPPPSLIITPEEAAANPVRVEGSYWSYSRAALKAEVLKGIRDAAVVYRERFGELPKGAGYLTDIGAKPTQGLYRSRK